MTIFFINSSSNFKNNAEEENGLVVNTDVLGNLLNKDSDQDGILDWEEGLWNTDPHNKDTNGDGINDKTEIERLKVEKGMDQPPQDPDTLTQTDKFSQELFVTVAALSQGGELDQASVDKISDSLGEQIRNSSVARVYSRTDMIVISDNSVPAVMAYDKAMTEVSQKYQSKRDPITILEESMMEDGEIDSGALLQLEPIIINLEGLVAGLLKIKTPSELGPLHLSYINSLQRLLENLNSIMLIDSDALIALGAISKYGENNDAMEQAMNQLNEMISSKLNG